MTNTPPDFASPWLINLFRYKWFVYFASVAFHLAATTFGFLAYVIIQYDKAPVDGLLYALLCAHPFVVSLIHIVAFFLLYKGRTKFGLLSVLPAVGWLLFSALCFFLAFPNL